MLPPMSMIGEKPGLKLNIKKNNQDYGIQSHHFMTNRKENVKVVTDFILLVSKITVDSICTHEIKKMLVSWKESYDRPRKSIKKQRHHFANKVSLVKAIAFPVVMYGCESWTIKNYGA